jgi:DNA polymerase-3 subunit gamma/tau
LKAGLGARRSALGNGDVLRMLTALTELEPRFRRSGQQQILLETMLVRFALLDHTVGIEEVLEAIGQRPAGSGGGGSGPSIARDSGFGIRKGAASKGVKAAPVAAVPPSNPESRIPSVVTPAAVLTLDALAPQWTAVVERLNADGQRMLAAALGHATPVGASMSGEITLQLSPDGSIYEQPLVAGAAIVLGAIRASFPSAAKLTVRVATTGTVDAAPKRITAESVKAERLASIRKKDPALDAAVDSLDLELLD